MHLCTLCVHRSITLINLHTTHLVCHAHDLLKVCFHTIGACVRVLVCYAFLQCSVMSFFVVEVVCEWRYTVLYWWTHSPSSTGNTDSGSMCVSHPHPHCVGNKGILFQHANWEWGCVYDYSSLIIMYHFVWLCSGHMTSGTGLIQWQLDSRMKSNGGLEWNWDAGFSFYYSSSHFQRTL